MEEKQLEKLNRFVHSVDQEIEARINEMLTQTKAEGDALLQSTEDETLQEAFDRIQGQVKAIEANYRKQLAQTEQEYRRALLSHRETLVAQIFDTVHKRLEAFTASAEYPAYLASLLDGEQLENGTTVFVGARDAANAAILPALPAGCTLETDDSIVLGGLSIAPAGTRRMIDKTLDSAFAEQRKAFCNNHALKL